MVHVDLVDHIDSHDVLVSHSNCVLLCMSITHFQVFDLKYGEGGRISVLDESDPTVSTLARFD